MDLEHDFAPEAKQLLDAIKITGERFGLGMPVCFLCGSVSSVNHSVIAVALPDINCRWRE